MAGGAAAGPACTGPCGMRRLYTALLTAMAGIFLLGRAVKVAKVQYDCMINNKTAHSLSCLYQPPPRPDPASASVHPQLPQVWHPLQEGGDCGAVNRARSYSAHPLLAPTVCTFKPAQSHLQALA